MTCVEYAFDRFEERTAKWVYDMRNTLGQSGWYKNAKKFSSDSDRMVKAIIEEYHRPAEKDGLNRFEHMYGPLNASFSETHFSWEPYVYWDLIIEMRVPSETAEMATAESLMSMETALIETEKISPFLFCYVGTKG